MPCSQHDFPNPCWMGFHTFAQGETPSCKKRSHLGVFSTFVDNSRLPCQRIHLSWREIAFAAHVATFFSGHLSLATWPDDCFAFGIRDYLFGYDFGSSGQYVCFPHDSFCCLGWQDYFAAETQWVLSIKGQPGEDSPGVDLVLPCSAVVLTDTLVLLTDGANCRGTISMAQSLSVKSWPKKSHTMNFCRVWAKELGFSQLKRFIAWAKRTQKQE